MSQNPRVIVRSPKKDVERKDFYKVVQASTTQANITLYTFPDKQTLMGNSFEIMWGSYDVSSGLQFTVEIYIADSGNVRALSTAAEDVMETMPKALLFRKKFYVSQTTGVSSTNIRDYMSKAKRKANKGQLLYLSIKCSLTNANGWFAINGMYYVGE